MASESGQGVRVVPAHLVRFLLYPRPAQLGVLSMLFVSGVAVYVLMGPYVDLTLFCSGGVIRGANVSDALSLVFLGGLVGAGVIGVAAFVSRYFLVAVLFLGAAMLGTAVALVAVDSATFTQDDRFCGIFGSGTGTSTARFDYLYGLWGVPLGVLVLAAAWALRRALRFRSNAAYDVYSA